MKSSSGIAAGGAPHLQDGAEQALTKSNPFILQYVRRTLLQLVCFVYQTDLGLQGYVLLLRAGARGSPGQQNGLSVGSISPTIALGYCLKHSPACETLLRNSENSLFFTVAAALEIWTEALHNQNEFALKIHL